MLIEHKPAYRVASTSATLAFNEGGALETVQPIAKVLIDLLHRAAPAEDFAQQLADVEALPEARSDKASLIETVRMAMAVRNRMEVLQQREQGMAALMESAQDLSEQLELTRLLAAIVARTRQLLGSDMAWISELDECRGVFQALASDGGLTGSSVAMNIRSDRGVASVVMSTRMPFTTPDYLHDTRFQHDPRFDDIFRAEGVCALVGVPVIWQDEVIGLLFAADRYSRVHTTQNIAILRTLATHGALALKNARNFERINAALGKADEARAELERHVRGVQAAADAHEEITLLLARGASLATLCQAVAGLLRGSLLVLDELNQVISQGAADGYDGTAAQAYQPHGEHSAELNRALRHARLSGRSTPAYEADGEICRVMPVIGGDDALGAIVLFHREPLEEVAARTFERSAIVIGIVLLSQERQQASSHRDMSALMRALVSPRQDELPVLRNRAERFGLDLTQPLSLMMIELNGPSAGFMSRRLLQIPESKPCLIDDIDGSVVLLCSTTRALALREMLSQWMKREVGKAYRGVLSRPMASPAELPSVFATIKRSMGVLRRLGLQEQLIGQNELALYSTLFETHDATSLEQFLEATIGPLIQHDRKRQTALTATLLCFFDSSQNARSTAQRLGIHVNTVRQRLATIEGLLGHLGQAHRALELHVALRLWSLRS